MALGWPQERILSAVLWLVVGGLGPAVASGIRTSEPAGLRSDDDGSNQRADCSIFVSSTHGDDENAGTAAAPLRTPEAAVLLRHRTPAAVPCTISLAAGTYYISAPPLVLGAEDSHTKWVGEGRSTVLSAGMPVNDTCWKRSSAGAGVYSCTLPATSSQEFRVITIGGQRKQPARFPDYDPSNPYTGGFLYINRSKFIGDSSFVVGVSESSLPTFALSASWAGAKMMIFPTKSWVNVVEISIKPAFPVSTVNGIRNFVVQCPAGGACSNTSNHLAIGPGNRFFIYNEAAALSAGEWHYEHETRVLSYHSPAGAPPTNVVVPQAASVVKVTGQAVSPQCGFSKPVGGRSPGSAVAVLEPMELSACMSKCCGEPRCLAVESNADHCYLFDRHYEGPSFINQSNSNSSIVADLVGQHGELELDTANVSLTAISFADTDFTYNGYQEGWGLTADASGMPRDAAVVIEGGARVRISECFFEQLGGGGVHLTQHSRYIEVLGSTFNHMGQSAVVLSGNGSTQPTRCTIANNTIANVGEILASAAGIMASTVSASNFTDNTITNTSRWGIAVRGGYSAPAESWLLQYGNRVERNHLSQLAQTTRDLGGLSFIGQGHTDTVVRHNCVRDVIGMDIDDSGRLMRPFYSWGIYLDNFATGFVVESNILNGNVLGGVFIHGGSSNAIVNNICYRSSNASMPGPGHYGHCDGSQGVLLGYMGPVLANNTVTQNIIVSEATEREQIAFIHATHHAPGGFANGTRGSTFNSNLYFSAAFNDSDSWPESTPLGSFAEWRLAEKPPSCCIGYGTASKVADPKFRNARGGDFGLQPGSPAIGMGFVPLPAGLDRC